MKRKQVDKHINSKHAGKKQTDIHKNTQTYKETDRQKCYE